MGRSPRTEIVFGDFRDEDSDDPWPWQDPDHPDYEKFDNDWETWLEVVLDVGEFDWSEYPEQPKIVPFNSPEYQQLRDKFKDDVAAWEERTGYREWVKAKNAKMAGCPLEYTYSGTDEWSADVIYLKGTDVVSTDWSPEEFSVNDLRIDDAALLQARIWAKNYGLDWKPKWLIVPSYM